MSVFSDRLKSLRRSIKVTQEKLADDLGVAKSLISMYENGKRLPSFEMLESIADYFNVPMSSLVGRNEMPHADMLPVSARRVPILGGAACGEPIYEPGDGTEYMTTGADDLACDFALIARGDSMIGDRIHDGDVVFFRAQPDVQDGEIAAVSVDDGVTIKRVKRLCDAQGNVYMTLLMSSNPTYAPIEIGASQTAHIMGRAVAFQSRLNK